MSDWKIIEGDALSELRKLDAGSARMCLTSPPYWQLRDYDAEGQLGLEPTVDEYVDNLVTVFREVNRVLADDGTLWLNIGDCYTGSGGSHKAHHRNPGIDRSADRNGVPYTAGSRSVPGVGRKNLAGLPWRLAFALQQDGADIAALNAISRARAALCEAYADDVVPDKVLAVLESLEAEYGHAKGTSWYLRSAIIWHKTNAMPNSSKDRPTSSYEYVFFMSKRDTYFSDFDAIAQPLAAKTIKDLMRGYEGRQSDTWKDYDGSGVQDPSTVKRNIIAGMRRKNEPKAWATHKGAHGNFRRDGREHKYSDAPTACGGTGTQLYSPKTETLATAHIRDVWPMPTQPFKGAHFATFPEWLAELPILAGSAENDTVLDPFAGSGTTGVVSLRHNRRFIGIEINSETVEMARRRIIQDAPLLNGVGHDL